MFTDFFGRSRKLMLIAVAIVFVLVATGFLILRTKTAPSVTPSPLPSLPAATLSLQSPTSETSPTPIVGKVPPYQGEPVSKLNPDPNFLKQELNDFSAQLAQNPGEVGFWKRVAQIKYFYDDYIGTRDAYEYLNQIAQSDAVAFYNLASLYGYDLKEPAKAIPKYREAIKLNPWSASFYIGFAGFYQDVLRDLKSAEEVLLAGEKQLPQEPSIAVALGSLYENTGKTQGSIAHYEKALSIGGYTKDEEAAIRRAIDRVRSKSQQPYAPN